MSVSQATMRPSVSSAARTSKQLLRALRIPAVLVVPHPLHAHGLTDRLRQQQRIGSNVIAAVGAVRSRAVEEDDAQFVGRDAEYLRQVAAQPVYALRRGPHGGAAVRTHVGDRTGRSK
jgi:hypothetical protein